MAADQPVGAQVGEDVDEKLRRDALRLGQVVGLDQHAVIDRGELHHGPDGVLRLRRHPHEAASCHRRCSRPAADGPIPRLPSLLPSDGPPSTHDYPRHLLSDPPRIGDTTGNRTTARPPSRRPPPTAPRSWCCRNSPPRATCSPTAPNSPRSPRPRDGPAITEWANLAEAFGLTIVAGFPEAAGDKVYNSAAVVDRTGLRGVYRKAHLWDSENEVFDRADDLPLLVDTEHGRIGVMVCYDVEFPEWVRAVALAGADLLCAPVNWPLLPRPGRRAPNRDGPCDGGRWHEPHARRRV